ncbi:MAG TPA: cytochrome-c oxidase, cbb3-type subunit I [Saprospiraceae bacterium]|nr:cytochrome-c oxidase, cbb3-type subunit I [Saprospiraceae bacterium]HRO07601.1 cytochrome-c oxidase, cbb3-type subunit I [Saprospiraceae bacterium]HRP40884.1 cytochrome-c oxidase, cbb3-type subunit I [Saprospiraceae bacterium]
MANLETFSYDNKVVRNFAYATIIFGVIGMLVGITAALQLVYPSLNFGLAETSFGRIRPLHTNAVIFAFVGNGIFTGVYYSLQRLLKTRMYSDVLSSIHFWGWQIIILAAAITLPLGMTSSHEYAELIWPIDIAIAIVWIVFGINMFGTLIKRREQHIYVAIWFYIATWITVTVLHIFNNIQIPVSMSYAVNAFAGVQDALVQWWYGHNAVAFFLTTPYLGLMYYFLPKAANRPVYSYKLSIIHFWSLIFLYIWAGPHHLLYTSLPDWAQSLGTVFSIMLIAPSWGGMLNGLLTLRGVWDKVRTDPILKFFVIAVTAYGMATLEGPLLSVKSLNAITHYTDWTVAHVHIGALGWNGMLTFGMLYWLLPRIYGTKLYSVKLANTHFWIGTLGILFYAIPLYWAGWTQSLMWKQFTPDGLLQYGNFLETVTQILPMYLIRAIGGTIYFIGVIVMIYNLYKTVQSGHLIANQEASAPALEKYIPEKNEHWHRWIERKPIQMLFWSAIVILIGGIIEIIPMMMIDENVPKIASVKPYTPLELEGRDIYIREGCVNCHSQMIRPFRSETERYGEYSKSGEFIYDRPFLWGSKRTGPDLHRIGGKYPDSWHYNHMLDPTSMSPGSIMPPYPWLLEDDLNTSYTPAKIRILQSLGTPYPDGYAEKAVEDLKNQAKKIASNLAKDKIKQDNLENKEIIAVIAYLQRLGTDIKVK